MNEKSFRIRTNVNEDKVVRVNLQNDIDFLEILSLKLSTEEAYKLHTSNYGVLVGRILANEAFGIPNAKVSIFIELSDDDLMNSEIKNIYPYKTIDTKNNDHIRYNLLPNESENDCYRVVGTFPNKRYVLDNDTVIEVYDTYWKYTTVTNSSGDYMIFGLPTGSQIVHTDVDLSDIGILSQKPIDFMYKGYNKTEFDNPLQFKSSTNLDNLAQIISQTSSTYIYPFWGDTEAEEIAISRLDIQLNYKIEPTCVFMGSIVTDNYTNNINHKCSASKYSGYNNRLVAPEGTIEMIRKTTDGLIEEYQIQGNRLIDGDGVFCYQIPMNLDYIGTDEYGNIIPTDNPKKGIPTKTSVRFRFSIQETGNEGIARHRAKYLVPNNPSILGDINDVKIANGQDYENSFEFGSATRDEDFRDLYWNKIYSIKNYIPRIQTSGNKSTRNYSALRSTNLNDAANPIPFNNIRIRLSFNYKLLCLLTNIVAVVIAGINQLINLIDNAFCPFTLKLPWPIGRVSLGNWICVSCIGMNMIENEDDDEGVGYYPGCTGKANKYTKKSKGLTGVEGNINNLMDKVQQNLSVEYDLTNLDFYNDWLNGCLYFPLWFWKKTKKKKYLFGLFSKKAVNQFCNCAKGFKKLRVAQGCSYNIDKRDFDNKSATPAIGKYKFEKDFSFKKTTYGVIKEKQNKDGLNVYYYIPGTPTIANFLELNEKNTPEGIDYVRLYATDIILLGTLNNCDLDSLPKFFTRLPSTTANVPYATAIIQSVEENDEDTEDEDNADTNETDGIVEVSGGDWERHGEKDSPTYKKGLFMDLACTSAKTGLKTCVNTKRLCELGVTLDGHLEDSVARNNRIATNVIYADGMVTRYELIDNDSRAMFASMNHNGLMHKVYNPNSGYDMYKMDYMYLVDFDGLLTNKVTTKYTSKMEIKTYDYKDEKYVNFRMGINDDNSKYHFYNGDTNKVLPLYNNSFYFYFGLNEGNTAIDKFNKDFYSSCFQNYKYPFTMTLEKKAADWCTKECDDIEENIDRLGKITFTSTDIRSPYTYKLVNEFDVEIASEENLSDKTISITGLTNGNYSLTISDYAEKTITERISLTQEPISLNYNVVELGKKFLDKLTVKEDICPDYVGTISIESFNIDGKKYIIESVDETAFEGTYDMVLHMEEGEGYCQKVQIVFIPTTPTEEQMTYSQCVCNTAFTNNIFYINVWVPGEYETTYTEYCGTELSDNQTTDTITVQNGMTFNAYINEVPLKFLIGDTEKIIKNGNFYDVNGATSPSSSTLSGWFNLQNESYYAYSATTAEFKETWSDFVDVQTELLEDNKTEILDEETLGNIALFKLKNLIDLSVGAYVDGYSNSNVLTLTHSGGQSPVRYRGNYPVYSTLEEYLNDNSNSQLYVHEEWVADTYGSVTCENNQVNITTPYFTYMQEPQNWHVDKHYRHISKEVFKNKDEGGPNWNVLFGESKVPPYGRLGNYFAAFTKNASFTDTCTDAKMRYQQIPLYASRMNSDVCKDNEEYNTNLFNDNLFKQTTSTMPYFRGLFVDRRMDYSFVIFTPYVCSDVVQLTTKDIGEWKKGRIYGTIFNGIDMAYDKETKYIVNPENTDEAPTKYTYSVYYNKDKQEAKTIYNTNDANKRFYNVTLKCGNTKLNITDALWSKNHTPIDEDIKNRHEAEIAGNSISLKDLQYNGDFSQANYPTKRFVNIRKLPNGSTYEFSATSCSLNCEYGKHEANELITATTSAGVTTTFKISTKNSIILVNANVDECATTNSYNILYKLKNDVFTKTNTMNAQFKIKADTANLTHNVYTKHPLFCTIKPEGKDQNYLDDALKKSDIAESINTFKEHCSMLGQIDDTVDDSLRCISENQECGIFKDLTLYSGTPNNHFVYDKEGSSIAYDDDSAVSAVNYIIKNHSLDGRDVVGIILERIYENAEDNNLLQELKVFSLAALYDVRKVKLQIVNNSTTIVEMQTSVGVTILNANGNDSSTQQYMQVITFNIEVTDNMNFNQQFYDYSRMSARFRAGSNVTSDVSINGNMEEKTIVNEEGNEEVIEVLSSVTITVNCTGSLLGKYLNSHSGITPTPNEFNECGLFIQMPSNLIYKFEFGLNSKGTSGASYK